MQGIEQAYCNECIQAVIGAWKALMETTPAEALKRVRYGKGDTLSLDAIPEINISERLREFDNHAILVTEELDSAAKKRWPSDTDPVKQPLMFFSDPTDRSKQLKKIIEETFSGKPFIKIGELMAGTDAEAVWENLFEPPASITGATTSITCIRKGSIIFSVMLNYITRTIFVASSIGIFRLRLPSFSDDRLAAIDLSHIVASGQTLSFLPAKDICRAPEDAKRFVTFLGKSGYRENFEDSMIFVDNPDSFLHHTEPGGPSRVLYLSELQKDYGPVGFVLANGEKIGEWMHWLAFVKFAKNSEGGPLLKVFEISIDRPWTKEGILMSTSPAYSIFSCEENGGYIDLSRLKNFDHPSRFRSMLVVTPHDNDRIIYIMRQHEYREVGSSL
ncbi:MAG: hypothetical protein A3H69_05500 [Candidatus Sungbacteria bacterium RIFCSPLOWO2_02_FULL_47_9]|uniref:Uncharacterized protein n=1 Tax=Candidatus Sungbacteria bacterium RIFCSPHIGHO2_01_FULL_47_32 TaxID=1802264 RepID=A0A1G2K6X8_9BACT|nr:MAG: hypothetical protein UX72_C0018G0003 [Parcubacteria group bacterium GW2011_GWA2_47_10]OGZ95199.1 MAG: hypothetical protein A2633_00230 [Candidatus Sungbacteria bacterium RIFCSPHIGHO2_01_FULL_47_32]OGZ98795.1 MAG: hypothetical protein A3D57_04635 [Candidatus Sungbacteria bacterium RIFCSPHIGHO2_02_FULL_46_12]OHA04663.1 MAG: hypothetical protein A3A28_04535 [Candidatus Sungbacteria bacterium RIFCSPLOWO2_01_FULL_47_32]OHA08913.1 MAG: hypothetical protein A3H69_05500 [Candidatus Sungbacteria